GNGFVGPLWYAIVLQTFVILITVYGILTVTLPLYHSTLGAFSLLVVVFAVDGVDRNLFNPVIPAQRALSAGWLLAAIIDTIWIVYFTSSPYSPIGRTLTFELVQRSTKPQQDPEPPQAIPSVPTNIDAFAYPLTNLSNQSQTHSQSRVPVGTVGTRTASTIPDGEGGARTGSAAMTDTRVISAAITDTQTEPSTRGGGGPGPAREHEASSPLPQRSPTTAEGEYSAHAPAPVAPAKDEKSFLFKAEALYDYERQEPAELSFKKREILEISDKSGKWWEARRQDGSSGIIPSNYVRLL
ncbi:hypothetical protein H0H92_008592, partial [Tricholoma furcatifolium]